MSIKYEDFDLEIQDLITELNNIGLSTFSSCAGHNPGRMTGYITFKINLDDNDKQIVRELLRSYNINGKVRFYNFTPNTFYRGLPLARVNFMSAGRERYING